MLQADGGEPVEVLGVYASVGCPKPQRYPAWAGHLLGEAGHGDAALHMRDGLLGGLQDLRVDEIAPAAEFGKVEDHKALKNAAMGRRDADAGGHFHGAVEVIEPFGDCFVEDGDSVASGLQGRVGIAADGKQCHGIRFPVGRAPGRLDRV